MTQQSYTVEFGWNNQKDDIVLAKTIVSHERDGDKLCSYDIVNIKGASETHKSGQTLVFENARVLPTPEKPGDKVSKIGVGIYKLDREALTYLSGAVYELYTVDDIYSVDGTKLLEAGTKLATSSTTNASGFTWFDVDIPIRAKTYPDSGNSGRYRIVEITALRVTCWTAPLWKLPLPTRVSKSRGRSWMVQTPTCAPPWISPSRTSPTARNCPVQSWKSVMQTAIWWRAGLPQKLRILYAGWNLKKSTP